MNKIFIKFALKFGFIVFISACETSNINPDIVDKNPEVDTTAPVISGAQDVSILIDSTFDPLTGVTALDNVDGDVTSAISVVIKDSLDPVVSSIDTTTAGVYKVTYTVTDTLQNTATKTITVTVAAEIAEPTNLVKNPDVSVDLANWNDSSVVYIADGASMTLSAEAGELKAVVVAGANSFTPRFGQMNIPFENGKTYEVSFDARSSVEKEISLQVGELLTSSPWFNDFLPGTTPFVFRTIGTTMQRYSFTFTMTQDNQKGGILFGLGTVKSQKVDATMYFDNFEIVESTPDADTTAPVAPGSNLLATTGADLFGWNQFNEVEILEVFSGDLETNVINITLDSSNSLTLAQALESLSIVDNSLELIKIQLENIEYNGNTVTAFDQLLTAGTYVITISDSNDNVTQVRFVITQQD